MSWRTSNMENIWTRWCASIHRR